MKAPLARHPVEWPIVPARSTYRAAYYTVGSIPSVIANSQEVSEGELRLVSQCLILDSHGALDQPGPSSKIAGTLLAKFLQRGTAPLPTIEVEQEALKTRGLVDYVIEKRPDSPDLGWDLNPALADELDLSSWKTGFKRRDDFAIDRELMFRGPTPRSREALGSALEERFLTDLLPKICTHAGQWLIPQASLDSILCSAGVSVPAMQKNRRVDFLICHPDSIPVVVEIDGSQHIRNAVVDEQRDRLLGQCGIKVFRIPTSEVQTGKGDTLRSLYIHWRDCIGLVMSDDSSNPVPALAVDCSNATKVQFVLAKAVMNGILPPGKAWEIHVEGMGSVANAAIESALDLLSGFDALYGGCSTPVLCIIRTDDRTSCWQANNGHKNILAVTESRSTMRIVVESTLGPYHDIHVGQAADFIVRSAYLPVIQPPDSGYPGERSTFTLKASKHAESALVRFLQQIFRKRCFLEHQQDAIVRILKKRDTVVLLPTGAGKSIIYQLAGLLMPGVTLVVDPLVALMEDQVDGLGRYGIDRARAISSGQPVPEEIPQLLESVEAGHYCFLMVTPERLQDKTFRDGLRQLCLSTLINLGVIDEAHCVSEWGHDFRPAYLNLGHNLRIHCQDSENTPPPLLALTGTASRAVQNDLITELQFDKADSGCVFRPRSFDRPELRYAIVRTRKGTSPQSVLRAVLRRLPSKFGDSAVSFYRPQQGKTSSGIVFVPTVNGPMNGICPVFRVVSSATNADVAVYSGSYPIGCGGPKNAWKQTKRQQARRFLDNDAPVLVTTNAFGMGIDKGNIRFTVHYGMPGSLEQFYQEAGRAGRDHKPAWCIVIFSENDPQRSNDLLDLDIDYEEFEDRYQRNRGGIRSADDIAQALYFYVEGRRGVKSEVADVQEVISANGTFAKALTDAPYPYSNDKDKQRKELAIAKLVKLGIIDDYWVSSDALMLSGPAFDLDRCKRQLISYVRTAQPSEALTVQKRMDRINGEDKAKSISKLATILIKFTYDIVERSRRRMLQEAILFAREEGDERDLRRRLMDYLQEGLGHEEVERLLRESQVDLLHWSQLLQLVKNPMDAGQLRGISGRLLVSHPRHPGLLFVRGLAEAMCSDHKHDVVTKHIKPAIRKCVNEHHMRLNQVVQLVQILYKRAVNYPTALGIPLTLALVDLCETEQVLGLMNAEVQSEVVKLGNQDVRLIFDAHWCRKVADKVNLAGQQLLRQIDVSSVSQLLEGTGDGES